MISHKESLADSQLADTASVMPMLVDRRSARMRGRAWLAVLVLAALVGAVGGWAASRTMKSPREVEARAQPPEATIITALVQSTKIQSAVISRGRIGAVDPVHVGYGVLLPSADSDGVESSLDDGASGGSGGSGTDVLTGVFAKRGDTVHQGQAVVEIDGRPVIVLQGAKTAYRDIRPGMSGVDVDQLQRTLAALGDYAGPISGVFDKATETAVGRMYHDAGYVAPTTDGGDGSDHAAIQADHNVLNDAISALADARAQRKSAMATLASQLQTWETAQAANPTAAGPRPTYQGPAVSELARDERAVSTAKQALDLDVAHRGTMVPRNEIAIVPHLPAMLTQIGTGVGYAPGSPLFTLSPDALVLTTQVPTSQAGFLSVGSRAEVDLLRGQARGTVTSVRNSATPGQTVIEISTPSPLPVSLEGRDVKVTFVAAATAGRVLAVPEGAISSDSRGNLSVIVQAASGPLTRIPVTVGVTGSDLVEVKPATPGAIKAGDKVVIGG